MNRRADPSAVDMTPGERLAVTRRGLVNYMRHERGQDRARARAASANDAAGSAAEPASEESHDETSGDGGNTWQTIKHAASAWWHSHPGRLALEVAEPVLQKYARAHPVKLLAVAAGTGALVVLAKPWRLVSFTSVAVAALKSSQLSGMAASFMRSKDKPRP